MKVVPYSSEMECGGIHNLEELHSSAAYNLAHNPNYPLDYILKV